MEAHHLEDLAVRVHRPQRGRKGLTEIRVWVHGRAERHSFGRQPTGQAAVFLLGPAIRELLDVAEAGRRAAQNEHSRLGAILVVEELVEGQPHGPGGAREGRADDPHDAPVAPGCEALRSEQLHPLVEGSPEGVAGDAGGRGLADEQDQDQLARARPSMPEQERARLRPPRPAVARVGDEEPRVVVPGQARAVENETGPLERAAERCGDRVVRPFETRLDGIRHGRDQHLEGGPVRALRWGSVDRGRKILLDQPSAHSRRRLRRQRSARGGDQRRDDARGPVSAGQVGRFPRHEAHRRNHRHRPDDQDRIGSHRPAPAGPRLTPMPVPARFRTCAPVGGVGRASGRLRPPSPRSGSGPTGPPPAAKARHRGPPGRAPPPPARPQLTSTRRPAPSRVSANLDTARAKWSRPCRRPELPRAFLD